MRWTAALVVVASLAACGGDDGEPAAPVAAPGCATALNEDGSITATDAWGMADLATETPIGDDTVFDIGSTSKQMTATAVLLLAQRGELDLDASLRSYLADMPAWADGTTIEHLLHHTSGIPDYIGLLQQDLDERTTVADARAAIAAVDELEVVPGTEQAYSNSGYFLLSLVVEAVDGRTLAAYLADEVFGPADIDAVMDPVLVGRATSYTHGEDGYVVADSPWEQTGDGAVQTTASELAEWGSQYWEPTVGGEALLAARTERAVGGYGAGIVVTTDDDGTTVLSHSGAWGGFVADLVIVPEERRAAAVLCNVDDVDPTAVAERILERA